MMKVTCNTTKSYAVDTIVSLNSIMVDGTGMCGSCRVTIGGKVKFSCVDGPEFDAHLVDWEELTKRNNIYLEKEKAVLIKAAFFCIFVFYKTLLFIDGQVHSSFLRV